jgi:hypothetical protein
MAYSTASWAVSKTHWSHTSKTKLPHLSSTLVNMVQTKSWLLYLILKSLHTHPSPVTQVLPLLSPHCYCPGQPPLPLPWLQHQSPSSWWPGLQFNPALCLFTMCQPGWLSRSAYPLGWAQRHKSKQDRRPIYEDQLYFYTLAMNSWKVNNPIFTVVPKRIKYTGRNQQKHKTLFWKP